MIISAYMAKSGYLLVVLPLLLKSGIRQSVTTFHMFALARQASLAYPFLSSY